MGRNDVESAIGTAICLLLALVTIAAPLIASGQRIIPPGDDSSDAIKALPGITVWLALGCSFVLFALFFAQQSCDFEDEQASPEASTT